MKLVPKSQRRSLAIVMGSALQERIVRKVLPLIPEIQKRDRPAVLSLESFYRLDLNNLGLGEVVTPWSPFPMPWYDLSRALKMMSLLPFAFQMLLFSRKFRNFLFFVDTGLLERTAIFLMKQVGCGTVVLQDALKRHPKRARPGSLQWFGGGKADLYLLMGERSRSMLDGSRVEVVGSPIYENQLNSTPLRNNILIVNQCFARYGETTIEEEYEFILQVVNVAKAFGNIELRLHPHNDPLRYQSLNSSSIHVTCNGPVHKSLEEAGIVLAINSTVILEAMAMGRPVLTLDWHPSPFELPVRDGVSRCSNIEEMRQALVAWKSAQPKMYDSTEEIQSELLQLNAYSGQEAAMRIVAALEKFMFSDGRGA